MPQSGGSDLQPTQSVKGCSFMNHPLPIEVGYVPPIGKKISIQLFFHTGIRVFNANMSRIRFPDFGSITLKAGA
jgi:hypothetical protein